MSYHLHNVNNVNNVHGAVLGENMAVYAGENEAFSSVGGPLYTTGGIGNITSHTTTATPTLGGIGSGGQYGGGGGVYTTGQYGGVYGAAETLPYAATTSKRVIQQRQPTATATLMQSTLPVTRVAAAPLPIPATTTVTQERTRAVAPVATTIAATTTTAVVAPTTLTAPNVNAAYPEENQAVYAGESEEYTTQPLNTAPLLAAKTTTTQIQQQPQYVTTTIRAAAPVAATVQRRQTIVAQPQTKIMQVPMTQRTTTVARPMVVSQPVMRTFTTQPQVSYKSHAHPMLPIEIAELDKEFVAFVEAPGVPKDQILLDLDTATRQVIISVNKQRIDPTILETNIVRSDCRFGKVRRALQLPSSLSDMKHVTASHKDGVVAIRFPKSPLDIEHIVVPLA